MRRLKRTAGVLLAGFLMFAPPGTLIFLFLVILGLVRNVWLVVGGVICLVVLAMAWLLRKKRGQKL